jgi:hypothetical protein
MRLTIDWDNPHAVVSPRLFGHNAVWCRGGLGIWDETKKAPHPEVLDLVKALRPGVLRFPGGTRAMRYHFDEALEGKAQCDPFLGQLDGTSYTIDAFLRFAEAVGAEVTLVTPWVDGTPEEAAAMIAYANADEGSTIAIGVDENGKDWGTAGDWAKKRGRPPWNVPFVEIGNEPYLDLRVGPPESCGRPSQFTQAERWVRGAPVPTTAIDHADVVARTARLIRMVDPSIMIGASAHSTFDGKSEDEPGHVDLARGGPPWNSTLVSRARDSFDFFALHPYDFTPTDNRLRLADRLQKTVHGLVKLAPEKAIAVTEHGFFFGGDTMMNAVVTADITRVAIEERLTMCLRHLLIEDEAKGLFADAAAILGRDRARTPGYFVMQMLRSTLAGRAVTVSSDVADVTAMATYDASEIGIVIIDRRAATIASTQLDVPLPVGRWTGEARILSASSLRSKDPDHSTQAIEAEASLRASLPSHAVWAARLRRA